jgi:tRNA threonylcarbamoyladenosine biosynthesis protein TsaB
VKEVEIVTSRQTPTVLAIDTSANDSSVAIRRGEKYLAALAVGEIHHHSQSLFEHLELALRLASVRIEEIDVFAAVSGPGSFTGLRVGLSAIKGIAGTLGRAVVGVTAFDALAASVGVKGNIASMIDAGRGEVYLGLRRVESDGQIAAIGRDVSGPINMALEQCLTHLQLERRPLFLIGSGAVRYSEQISQLAEDAGIESRLLDTIDPEFTGWSIFERCDFLAGSVAAVAARGLTADQSSSLHAYYLKPSDAELKWTERSIPKTR